MNVREQQCIARLGWFQLNCLARHRQRFVKFLISDQIDKRKQVISSSKLWRQLDRSQQLLAHDRDLPKRVLTDVTRRSNAFATERISVQIMHVVVLWRLSSPL